MSRRTVLSVTAAVTVLVAACAAPPSKERVPAESGSATAEAPKLQAPLFTDLGEYSVRITTDSALAQRFFDQGLTLAYGFNHAEAARSFREAARLDAQCAMCHWGIAFVLGPNINVGMFDESVAEAYAESRKALELAGNATPRERALIEALARRYAAQPVADRSALDGAYADAMRQAARAYPDDLEVQTIFAESLMDLMPWKYWVDGQPQPATLEVVAALEHVMKLRPDHPGANHLYIHAVEASPQPSKAESAADRLGPLAPGAGHLVHMPSHIYIRIGRYHDAAVANIKAGEADTSYIAQCQAQGVYPLLYHPHNWHFLWSAATFSGKSEWAKRGADRTRELMGTHRHDDAAFGPVIQHFWLTPVFDDVRFGRWDQVLAMPRPEQMPYTLGVWHYARGMAHAAKGDLAAAVTELEEVRRHLADPALPKVVISVSNNASHVVKIAERVLTADIESRRGHRAAAIAVLREAVALEDALGYNEPEDWHFPVRQALGAVLLDDGKAAEAETIYREELQDHPENGWSLFGLEKALRAQSRGAEADAVRARFERAWANADIELTASVVR
jgi:tetratricopeptide (TPR) repeat protein